MMVQESILCDALIVSIFCVVRATPWYINHVRQEISHVHAQEFIAGSHFSQGRSLARQFQAQFPPRAWRETLNISLLTTSIGPGRSKLRLERLKVASLDPLSVTARMMVEKVSENCRSALSQGPGLVPDGAHCRHRLRQPEELILRPRRGSLQRPPADSQTQKKIASSTSPSLVAVKSNSSCCISSPDVSSPSIGGVGRDSTLWATCCPAAPTNSSPCTTCTRTAWAKHCVTPTAG